MATQSHAMVALQTSAGLNFGHVRHMSATDLVFEADAKLNVGDSMAWRMELLGWKETVMGHLTVRQVQARSGDVPVFHGRIDSIAPADRPLFEIWLRDSAAGGVSRRYDENPNSLVESALDAPMRGATQSETSTAFDRIAKRRTMGRKMRDRMPGEESDPFGLEDEKPSDTSSAPAGSGRRAIREALRASLGQQRPRGPRSDRAQRSGRWISGDPPSDVGGDPASDPSDVSEPNTYSGSGMPRVPRAPDWLERLDSVSDAIGSSGPTPAKGPAWLAELHSVSTTDSTGDRHSETPSWLFDLNPTAASAPADDGPRLLTPEDPTEEATQPAPQRVARAIPSPDPTITIDSGLQPTRVTAAWRTQGAYQRDFRQHLRGCGLFVPEPGLGPLDTPIEVRLVLPGGLEVQCKASVVAPMIAGTGLALHLGKKDRRALSLAADTSLPHAPGS